MRIDQWLWAIRVYRSRSLAADAIRRNLVEADGRPVKAAHEVAIGEEIRATKDLLTRTFVVLGIPPSRIGANRVGEFAKELTLPEEFQRARDARPLPSAFPSLKSPYRQPL